MKANNLTIYEHKFLQSRLDKLLSKNSLPKNVKLVSTTVCLYANPTISPGNVPWMQTKDNKPITF